MQKEIDIDELVKDLKEIEAIGAMLELKCRQTRKKLEEAGVSTQANLSQIAIAARINLRKRYKLK